MVQARHDYPEFEAVDYKLHILPALNNKPPKSLAEVADAAERCWKAGKRKKFTYPNGPSLYLADGEVVDMSAPSPFPFRTGAEVTNIRGFGPAGDQRTEETKVRAALVRQKAQIAGCDIDHVLDLGFEGKDLPTNLWPLPAHINRRPWMGWRMRYGFHYRPKDDPTELKAGVIAELKGSHFKAKDHLDSAAGAVPAEGAASPPAPTAGTDGAAQAGPSGPSGPSAPARGQRRAQTRSMAREEQSKREKVDTYAIGVQKEVADLEGRLGAASAAWRAAGQGAGPPSKKPRLGVPV